MSILLLLPLLLQYQRNIALGGYAARPRLTHQPLVERPVQLQEQLHGDDIAREWERTVKDAHIPSLSLSSFCHCSLRCNSISSIAFSESCCIRISMRSKQCFSSRHLHCSCKCSTYSCISQRRIRRTCGRVGSSFIAPPGNHGLP